MHRLLLITFIASVSANTCPEVTPVYNFNFSSYGEGIWYEFARYLHPLLDLKCQCNTNIFTFNGNYTNSKTIYIINNKEVIIDSIITFTPDATNAGKMVYEAVKTEGVTTTSDSRAIGKDTVLAIDYDNYAIVQSCQFNEVTKKYEDYVWVLSRSKHPSEKTRSEIENFIKNSTVIDSSKFLYTRYDDDACRIDP